MSLSVLFGSFFGFDGLIFIIALVNAGIFYMARKSIMELYDTMHRRVYAPSPKEEREKLIREVETLTDQQVDSLRETAVKWYTIFGTITGIFPLMGILGTVISLLSMVGDKADIQGGFFMALTSTFWGLVFAIIYKFLDGFISPKLEDGERSVELFFNRWQEDKE